MGRGHDYKSEIGQACGYNKDNEDSGVREIWVLAITSAICEGLWSKAGPFFKHYGSPIQFLGVWIMQVSGIDAFMIIWFPWEHETSWEVWLFDG